MQGPEGPQPRDGTAEAARGGSTAIAGETTVNNTAAEAAVGASSAGARFKPPPEGGAAGRNDGIARRRNPAPAGGWDSWVAMRRSRAYSARIWSCGFGRNSKRKRGIEQRGCRREDIKGLEEE